MSDTNIMSYLMAKNIFRNPLNIIIAIETKSAVDDKHVIPSTSTKADSNTTKNKLLLYHFKD